VEGCAKGWHCVASRPQRCIALVFPVADATTTSRWARMLISLLQDSATCRDSSLATHLAASRVWDLGFLDRRNGGISWRNGSGPATEKFVTPNAFVVPRKDHHVRTRSVKPKLASIATYEAIRKGEYYCQSCREYEWFARQPGASSSKTIIGG
jgi:hypothetical protein